MVGRGKGAEPGSQLVDRQARVPLAAKPDPQFSGFFGGRTKGQNCAEIGSQFEKDRQGNVLRLRDIEEVIEASPECQARESAGDIPI